MLLNLVVHFCWSTMDWDLVSRYFAILVPENAAIIGFVVVVKYLDVPHLMDVPPISRILGFVGSFKAVSMRIFFLEILSCFTNLCSCFSSASNCTSV